MHEIEIYCQQRVGKEQGLFCFIWEKGPPAA